MAASVRVDVFVTRAGRPFHVHPPPRAGDGVAERGKMAHADEHLAVDLQTQQHAEQRDAVHEAACAVDRIDEPAVRRVAAIVAELLADDRVRREAVGNRLADQALGASIRDGDRRAIGFQLDLERGLIVRAHEAPGLLRQIDGKLEEGARASYWILCHVVRPVVTPAASFTVRVSTLPSMT